MPSTTMKKNLFNFSFSLLGLAFIAMSAVSFMSCKEEISSDAYAIKDKPTLIDKIDEKAGQLSYIRLLFNQVKLGNKSNASSIAAVLSARGHYTVFAPDNNAVLSQAVQFAKENEENGLPTVETTLLTDPATLTEDQKIEVINAMTDEQKSLIVLNCIIDNGSNSAYETADFPPHGTTFPISNLNNRALKCTLNADGVYVIGELENGSSVIDYNYECSNGMLHVVDKVILPSTKSISQLIGMADNMKIFSKLLEVTGIYENLLVNREAAIKYEEEHSDYAGSTVYETTTKNNYTYQAYREVGFTCFAETDDVFQNDWGIQIVKDEDGNISNWDTEQVFETIKRKCTEVYGSEAADDYTDPKNAVYQFIAYHLLNGKMPIDKLVRHFDEYGYHLGNDMKNPNAYGYTVNVWDYYTTMSSPAALIKVTQLPTEEFYLNRVSQHDNKVIGGTYEELSFIPNNPGVDGLNIQVFPSNSVGEGDNLNTFDNNSANGFYFPIDHVLLNTDYTRTKLASERIRIDMVTMLPEMLSNDLRGTGIYYFPKGYFSNISNETTGTKIYYLQNGYASMSGAWKDYKGDEILVSGRYDFVLKLPPVPKTGTYEIRMGASLNNLRGMVQVFFGESPTNTQPTGLPVDQRETINEIPGKPWKHDEKDLNNDEVLILEADRNLRNVGYMKAPQYMVINHTGTDVTETCRNATPESPALRRIITTQTLDQNKQYYLRFKLAIENASTQLMLDYFEFVPASVYNNSTPEDIW